MPTQIPREAFLLAALTELSQATLAINNVCAFLEALGDMPDRLKDADAIGANITGLYDILASVTPTPSEEDEDEEAAHAALLINEEKKKRKGKNARK